MTATKVQPMKSKRMKTEDFDKAFDEGSDKIDEAIDWSTAKKPDLTIRKVNIDMPVWMIEKLDEEAKRIGITRQALTKTWLADRLDSLH